MGPLPACGAGGGLGASAARALIGKYEGDVAEVHTPGGVREYEVLDVKYV